MSFIHLNPLPRSGRKRLCEATHELAKQYLSGAFQSRLQACGFQLSELNLPPDTAPEIRHGKNTILTARKSRMDILPEELLAGSELNIESTWHCIPGYEYGGSISHTTADFGDAVRLGLSGLEKEIRGRRKKATEPQQAFYCGLLDVIEAMRIWTRRYIDAYEGLLSTETGKKQEKNIRSVIARLENVPENPPRTFPEAVQSLWSFFEFQRLCGNWSGLGRIDLYLGGYLRDDLKNGTITLDEAREYLAHFWIKGSEWCYGLRADTAWKPGSGDAQNYQNIILGGVDEDGNQVENEVTFLVLDVVEELHISDYPVTVRLNEKTSPRLLRRIAEVQLLGGGIVSVYNEPVVLKGLTKLGLDEREARSFTNDGCWEIIVPGKTNFGYFTQDVLLPFQDALFAEQTLTDFDALYRDFLRHFRNQTEDVKKAIAALLPAPEKDATQPYTHADVTLSLLMPSCRESGRSYTLFGTKYTIRGLHMAGLPDVANSFYAIKKLVFENPCVTLPELVEILKNDWRGEEALRLRFANSLSYYGNDNAEADTLLRRIFSDCTDILWEVGKVGCIMTAPGVSTFGREIAFAPARLATAFGKHAHEYLAPNLTPTPGTDKHALTAVLNSYCKMDFTKTPNGCPLDLRLSADIRRLPDAPDLLAQVLLVFLKKGGMYLQIDTVDPEMLKAAQKDPDRFPNLVVRISGWSARFASLDKTWQDMIIRRTSLELR